MATAIPATTEPQEEVTTKVVLTRTSFYALVIGLGFLFSLPFLWALLTSFKTSAQLYDVPPSIIPNPVSVEAWREMWVQVPMPLYLVNSTVVTVFSLVGQLISSSLAAYAFARLRFRGREVLFLLVLSALMLPFVVTLIPTYLLFRTLGWLDSYLPLIIPNWFAAGGGSAVTIFLLRQFFKSIPYDYDEAAKIDGANHFTVYLRIILPMSRPVLISLFALNFVQHWNRFIEPLIYLKSPEKMTLPVGLRELENQVVQAGLNRPTDHLLMAGSLVALVPALILYLVAQRYLVSITIGGTRF